jgi:hypothetical protein
MIFKQIGKTFLICKKKKNNIFNNNNIYNFYKYKKKNNIKRKSLKFLLSNIPESKEEIEEIFKNEFIECMASTKKDNFLKFFMYAQNEDDVTFLFEIKIEENKIVIITMKSDKGDDDDWDLLSTLLQECFDDYI